jgi:acyl dehydratase
MIFRINENFEHTFTVSQSIYQDFIQLFNDKNPLHTEESFAVKKGFKGRVMHGNILNGFISYFVGECLPTKNVIIHSQNIQFLNPVYLNDTVQFTATVAGVYESVAAVEFKFAFKNSELKIVAKGKIQIGLLK